MRSDGRDFDQLRPVELVPGYIEFPEGSVLISLGKTRVLCNVTIEEGVPRWMQNQNISGGWISGEYAMLPRATQQRNQRDGAFPNARSQEIRRLIGRSLRSAFDLEKLGVRTCTVDCDVLQADGGTRTAAITGGYVAMVIAVNRLVQARQIPSTIFRTPVAAVSVGRVTGRSLLDLNYQEDSRAESDVNVVMTGRGEFVEIQGTAEGQPFTREQLDQMLMLASKGISELFTLQQEALQQCSINLPSLHV